MRAKIRNLCVEKAIEIKNETVNEIVDREIAKSEQDPEHENSKNQFLLGKSPPLPPHNRIRNTSPEGSNFSQTRPASRSNTPDKQDNTEIQYRPLIPRNRNAAIEIDEDDQLLITFGTSTNNDREREVELNEEELPEENIPIDAYNELNFQQFLNYINPLNELNNYLVLEINNNSDNNSEDSNEEMAFVVKPPKFSGTHNEDPKEWLEDFVMACHANNWNDERTKNAFGAYLRKGAREWYLEWYEANNEADWPTTRDAFSAKYCNDAFKEQWLDELRGLKQRKHQETFRDFHICEKMRKFSENFRNSAGNFYDVTSRKFSVNLRPEKFPNEGELVEEYYYQVKKMAGRAGITANATLPHFVQGLLPNIKAVVKTHAPANLVTALTKAKLFEQGKGTSKRHKKTKKYESSSEDSDNESSEDEKP
ncbi:hypothetical protein Glove_165g94 [Diversispora epigaea]|uniref:Retrotransposon gag domain-containing protein n=1 Tax=Diversispora epigaea TaxID=1348612 RepID=A0A397J0C6_9GLOM|nr:hypothetical protein Glove_165g94 [Diversispora epigaea]